MSFALRRYKCLIFCLNKAHSVHIAHSVLSDIFIAKLMANMLLKFYTCQLKTVSEFRIDDKFLFVQI